MAAFLNPRRRCFATALLLGLALLASPLVAAPTFVREHDLIDRVMELIDRRLALMPEVAAAKFPRQIPVADPAREREVIEQSVADARALHLDPEAARGFFTVQIMMARAVQEQLFARWRAGTAQRPAARDLAKDLRPQLDVLGRELLPAVYLASPALVEMSAAKLQERCSRVRRHAGITEDHLVELARALGALRIAAAPSWALLQRIGVLRVGTTGDYAPFSDDRSGTLQGLDIELAQVLGKTWGVSVVFIRTSWPTLMDDLSKHRFDLAVSGISVTPERQRQADFSAPYYFDGKTPVARRENAARFSSLAGIDQPGVRVIVNPGGTNERFVREHLKRATVILHPDNRTIFAEIVAGRADVMLTDGVEVRLQERQYPELQGTMTEPFTRAAKAILLPARTDLLLRVDAWLKAEVERGRVATQLARILSGEGGQEPAPARRSP